MVRARRCETNISEKARLVMEDTDHGGLLEPHHLAFRHSGCCRNAPRLSCQATFTAELVRAQDCDDGFLTLLGEHGDLDLALLNVEHGVCWIALREYYLDQLDIWRLSSPILPLARKAFGSNGGSALLFITRLLCLTSIYTEEHWPKL